jgi:hypothetical protein
MCQLGDLDPTVVFVFHGGIFLQQIKVVQEKSQPTLSFNEHTEESHREREREASPVQSLPGTRNHWALPAAASVGDPVKTAVSASSSAAPRAGPNQPTYPPRPQGRAPNRAKPRPPPRARLPPARYINPHTPRVKPSNPIQPPHSRRKVPRPPPQVHSTACVKNRNATVPVHHRHRAAGKKKRQASRRGNRSSLAATKSPPRP